MPEDTVPVMKLKGGKHPTERRTQKRIPCDLILCCRLVRRRQPLLHLVNVSDISTWGIGLVLDRSVAPGAILAIELQRRQRVTRTLLARVAHAAETPDGSWAVGCEFASQLTLQELQELLS